MSRALADIRRRRAQLQAASAHLRGQAAGHAAELARPLALLSRVESAARQLMARPVVAAAVAAAMAGLAYTLGPRRSLAWVAKGWTAWRLWRRLRG